MDWLKEILGEELYKQFETAVSTHNSKTENKEKQIKLADLGKGEYVSKEKYSSLETDKGSVASQLQEAQNLIAELKKDTKTDETLQGKIGEYETTITTLTAENEKLKTESALKIALLDAGAKASDIDYLMYKAKEKGDVKIGDDGKIKSQEDLLSGLKTQCPSQFITAEQKKIEEHKIETGGNQGTTISKEDFAKMGYQSRTKLFNEQPDVYKELSGKTTN